MKLFINSSIFLAYIVLVAGLPNSLVERIRASELGSNKVKRAEQAPKQTTDHKHLTAIKRGIKQPNIDEENFNEWEQVRRSALNNFDNISPSSLYNSEMGGNNEGYDDKTIAEYEKGFHYGINKDQLDEALENAVLKTEMYGDPAAINQYRYYGGENKKRRRRDLRKLRFKRDVELTPEEVLALLSLYENSHNAKQTYDVPSSNYYRDEQEDETENWLNGPVMVPHASDIGPNYLYNSGFMDGEQRPKRFMVAKKRMDPTRELRHLNGPNRDDFYTLSQLLNNQHEPNVPVYHRLML